MVACVISKNKKKKDNGDMGLINKSQIQKQREGIFSDKDSKTKETWR